MNDIFPGLIAIDIDSCGLKQILRENLVGWDLSEFYAGSNDLKKLPDDLFVDMKNLKSISFKGNKQLSTVASKLLQTIKENDLSYVDFRDNSLIDELFELGRRKSVASMDVLIESIDKNCKKSAPTFEIQHNDKFFRTFFQGRENLLDTGRFSDMKICVGVQEIQVHKAIITNQCEKFDKILENHLDSDRIEIDHIRFDYLKRFVRFLYTGNICIDEFIIFDLFKLTDPTQYPEMKKACEKVFKEIIDEENAEEIMKIAEMHGMKNLKKLATEIIMNMCPKIEVVVVNQPEEEMMCED